MAPPGCHSTLGRKPETGSRALLWPHPAAIAHHGSIEPEGRTLHKRTDLSTGASGPDLCPKHRFVTCFSLISSSVAREEFHTLTKVDA
jgi:hypothetical protein